jgi:hypothetical protein
MWVIERSIGEVCAAERGLADHTRHYEHGTIGFDAASEPERFSSVAC